MTICFSIALMFQPLSRKSAASHSSNSATTPPHAVAEEDEVVEVPNRIAAAPQAIRQGKRVTRESQPMLLDKGAYELPPLRP